MSPPSITRIVSSLAGGNPVRFPNSGSVWGDPVTHGHTDWGPRQVVGGPAIRDFFGELREFVEPRSPKTRAKLVQGLPGYKTRNHGDLIEYTVDQMREFGGHIVVVPIGGENKFDQRYHQFAYQIRRHQVVCVLDRGPDAGSFIVLDTTARFEPNHAKPTGLYVANGGVFIPTASPGFIENYGVSTPPLVVTTASRWCWYEGFSGGMRQLARSGYWLDPFYPYSQIDDKIPQDSPPPLFRDELGNYVRFISNVLSQVYARYVDMPIWDSTTLEIYPPDKMQRPLSMDRQKFVDALDMIRRLHQPFTWEEANKFDAGLSELDYATYWIYDTLRKYNPDRWPTFEFPEPLVSVVGHK